MTEKRLKRAALALVGVLALLAVFYTGKTDGLGDHAERLYYAEGGSVGALSYDIDLVRQTAAYTFSQWVDGIEEKTQIELTDAQLETLRQAISDAHIERWKPEYGADINDSCGTSWTFTLTAGGEERIVHGYVEQPRRLPGLLQTLKALF